MLTCRWTRSIDKADVINCNITLVARTTDSLEHHLRKENRKIFDCVDKEGWCHWHCILFLYNLKYYHVLYGDFQERQRK